MFFSSFPEIRIYEFSLCGLPTCPVYADTSLLSKKYFVMSNVCRHIPRQDFYVYNSSGTDLITELTIELARVGNKAV